MSRIEQTITAKKQKRQALETKNILVHPYNFDKQQMIAQAIALVEQQKVVKTAGRITAWRAHGKVVFLDLTDETGKIQVMLHQARLPEGKFELTELIDAGDFLGVTGEVEKTKTGEVTVIASDFEFLGKALRPLPSSFNTAVDKEARFRQRYLDLLINPRSREILRQRFEIMKYLRRFMQDELGYTEVETPILQPLYGGTNARPFTTKMKALDDAELYLRIAPELYLKRLIIGGMDKVYEIARNFRNEGIDQTHLPEFSMIEWYRSYADYRVMMSEVEALIKYLNQQVNQSEKLLVGEREINLSPDQPWVVYTMKESLAKFENLEVDKLSDQELQELLTQNKLKPIGEFTRGKAIFSLFDHLVSKKLVEPTWIIDYPKDVSPLAKAHRTEEGLTERYELYIGGKEISDGWSEVTDPLDQRARFENEQKRMREGDEEAQPLDEDFLEAMEYGMPPLGGVGLGIDRLVMLLTNTWAIKEVIPFPTLKSTRG